MLHPFNVTLQMGVEDNYLWVSDFAPPGPQINVWWGRQQLF